MPPLPIKHSYAGHRSPVYALAEGAVPGTFISGGGDGLVVRWHQDQPENGEVLVTVGQAVFSLCLHRDHGLLLIGTEGGGLHVVDLHTRKEMHLFDVHRKGIFRILALPEDRVACAGGDGTLSIWTLHPTLPRMQLLRHMPLAEEKLRDLALSPDGKALAVACGDGTVRILDSELFNELHTLPAHIGAPGATAEPSIRGATGLAYHPDKPVLITGGKDGYLRTWHSMEGYRMLHVLPAHKGGIYRLLFHADGLHLATASRDKTAKLWDARTMDPVARLDRAVEGHSHSVNALLWLGDALLSAGDDRTIIRWTGLW